jgi:DNA-binding NtrC family response regulator
VLWSARVGADPGGAVGGAHAGENGPESLLAAAVLALARFSLHRRSMKESPASPLHVLIVDDEPQLRRAHERHLRRAGYQVSAAATVEEGRSELQKVAVDVAFVDFRLPDGTGADLIRWASANRRARSIYCMTAFASCRTAVEVMQAGCLDVLEKPFDVDKLLALLADFSRRVGSEGDAELRAWRQQYAPEILGEDPRLVEVLKTVRSVADADCNVLITGESGTGKELVARAVHDASPRRGGPFVALNCAAIPESMIEAELFGHHKGAFTGALTARVGRIASAHGGTLFLDEIGDMPLAAQAKLLRMLQDHTIVPVGSDEPVAVDVRVVAATNRNLEAMVVEGKFRPDLFYRLSVIPVELPPLRERGDDVVLLAERFVELANRRNRREVTGLDRSAVELLRTHSWPGNVRELGHLVERVVLLKRSGALTAADLRLRPVARAAAAGERSPALEVPADGLDLRRAIDKVERSLIDEALERTGGNRTEAAALLGLNRTTLVEKLRKYGG